ncbi:3'-5' exonuclease [Desulfosporosinus nitroreducens]|uniref:3'-5' exonuclease n=1 Tax=Desulfosporosinus nitroreducens TaxID=2018668 RepID=UPI00265CE869|nr:3'-5' exonuclease [Desulfosporosinus nitroreducens]
MELSLKRAEEGKVYSHEEVSAFIHKAKGRKFDNVFLMLDQFNLRTEEAIRPLYVAMTRAKRNLTIHYNWYQNLCTNVKIGAVKDNTGG